MPFSRRNRCRSPADALLPEFPPFMSREEVNEEWKNRTKKETEQKREAWLNSWGNTIAEHQHRRQLELQAEKDRIAALRELLRKSQKIPEQDNAAFCLGLTTAAA
eukprot:Seg8667.1 transcript_id=Seg8667.1/GoldUCD/mRNA.D3Y31 product="hypothetical protein" protein_id=Seg8667.1/GoldUCD/D3Y31